MNNADTSELNLELLEKLDAADGKDRGRLYRRMEDDLAAARHREEDLFQQRNAVLVRIRDVKLRLSELEKNTEGRPADGWPEEATLRARLETEQRRVAEVDAERAEAMHVAAAWLERLDDMDGAIAAKRRTIDRATEKPARDPRARGPVPAGTVFPSPYLHPGAGGRGVRVGPWNS